jgi:methyl coenzyme M reductase alpha subunit
VFTEGGDVFVRAIRPTMLSRALDGAQASDVAARAERLVLEVIDAVAGDAGEAAIGRSSSI